MMRARPAALLRGCPAAVSFSAAAAASTELAGAAAAQRPLETSRSGVAGVPGGTLEGAGGPLPKRNHALLAAVTVAEERGNRR